MPDCSTETYITLSFTARINPLLTSAFVLCHSWTFLGRNYLWQKFLKIYSIPKERCVFDLENPQVYLIILSQRKVIAREIFYITIYFIKFLSTSKSASCCHDNELLMVISMVSRRCYRVGKLFCIKLWTDNDRKLIFSGKFYQTTIWCLLHISSADFTHFVCRLHRVSACQFPYG